MKNTTTTTMTVRVGPELNAFIQSHVGERGSYENVSEYVRDLIRRDKKAAEDEALRKLKAELELAFAVPDEDYTELSEATLDSIKSRYES